jgi:hypothetical protein
MSTILRASAAFLAALILTIAIGIAQGEEPKVKIRVPVVIDGEPGYMVYEQYLGEDEENPAIEITYPAQDSFFSSSTLNVMGSATDNRGVTEVEVRVNNKPWSLAKGTISWSKTVKLREGENVIEARAKDAAGNTGYARVTVYLDATPPSISIRSPASGTRISQVRALVEGTAEDESGIAKVEVKVNDGVWRKAEVEPMAVIAVWPKPAIIPVEWRIDVELEEGRNVITARATDAYGNAREALVVVRASTILIENGDFETGSFEGWDTSNVLNPAGGRVSTPEIVRTERGYSAYLLCKDQQPYWWWPGSGHIDQIRRVVDGVDYDALTRLEFSVWSRYRGGKSGYLPWWGSKGVVEFRVLDEEERLIKKYSIYYSPRNPKELLEDYDKAIVEWKPTGSYDAWNHDVVKGKDIARELNPVDRKRVSKIELRAYVYSFGFIDGDAELWVDDFTINAVGRP